MYTTVATAKTPALIIYLLDVSGSMGRPLGGAPKIEHVNQSIENLLIRMVGRSTKGQTVSPRYRVAMCAYSNTPQDMLGGILSIDQLAKKGRPRLGTSAATDTAAAFMWARDLLRLELPSIQSHPAPLVCHLTDGEFTGTDPAPIAREIMQMTTEDGNVLVENIYVGADLTKVPIADATQWPGIQDVGEISDPNAAQLFQMSSQLPKSYASVIQEEGYNLQAGAPMLIPGTNKDLIELAFAMSGATPTS